MRMFLDRYLPSYAPEGAAGGGSGAGPGAPSAPAGGAGESSSPSSASSGAASTAQPSGPGGAATTPAPAPAGLPSEAGAPSSGAAGPESSFEGLMDDSQDDDFDSLNLSPQAEPVAPQPVQPQPVQPTAPVQVAQQPVAPQAPGPQEAPLDPASIPSPAEPGRIAELLLRDEAAISDHLASTEFQLTQADLEALETDVATAVPKLLSRVYVKSQINMMKQLERMVPAIIQRYNKVTASNDRNESHFYTRWPALNQAEHSQLVNRLAMTYRQMNPGATLEQMTEELGPIVMMTAKIGMQPGAPQAPNGGFTQAGGTVPAAGGARLVRAPSPFRPAMGGAGAIPQPADDNPWMGLAGRQNDEE